ncbi:MAG: serine/threonine protein kinase, partial [Myxococcota bacterium]|nr:serine/threonine protein kinase [Myxococcota bacterium]
MADDAAPGAGSADLPGREEFATTAPGADTSTPASVADLRVTTLLPAAGYELGELIGRGGMGEVYAAHDQRIGREVALKRMRSSAPTGEALSRFLREVRIQGRLDHPAIVPVHELGTDEVGRPYFIMKRLTGRTLSHRLADGGSQNRILRAFIEVCLAIEFAHARGVVHRDLKPSNIMLGDYGEVYVLDWGIARVLTEPRVGSTSDRHDAQQDVDTLDQGTQAGSLLGTPGYMAPEQIRGQPALQAADVYALGSILFEILAGEPLHPRGQAAITSTLSQPQASPASRRGGDRVPPELDALCVA